MGDFTNWDPVAGTQEDGNIVWSFEVEQDARLEYCFQTHDDNLVPDPDNPFRVCNGLGHTSELVMPDYRYHPVFEPFRHGMQSTVAGLEKRSIQSRKLGYTKDVWIYDPHPQSASKTMLVFQDGLDYIEFAHAVAILDYLYSAGSIPPVLALFVNPPNRHVEGLPNRMTEYGMNAHYAVFLAEELVPVFGHITKRAIIGASYGGLCAIHTALLYPHIFPTAYSQSGYVGFRRDAIFAMVEAAGQQVRIIAECGSWEHKVGSSFLDFAETDFTAANRRFKNHLRKTGVPHIFNEHHEGHTWGYWRNGLVRMLPVIMERNLR